MCVCVGGGGSGQMLTIKTRCICVHICMLATFFPLFMKFGGRRTGAGDTIWISAFSYLML